MSQSARDIERKFTPWPCTRIRLVMTSRSRSRSRSKRYLDNMYLETLAAQDELERCRTAACTAETSLG